MSKMYAKALPIDENGLPMHNSPPNTPALQSTTREAVAASSVTSFNANTTVVGVTAIGVGIAVKWAGNQASSVITDVSGPNYDYVVPVNTTQILVVPQSVRGAINSVVGKGVAEGLYSGIATKTVAGAGSVLLAEY